MLIHDSIPQQQQQRQQREGQFSDSESSGQNKLGDKSGIVSPVADQRPDPETKLLPNNEVS